MVRGVNSSDVYFASFWGVIAAAQAAAAASARCGRRPFLLCCRPLPPQAAVLRGARQGCPGVFLGEDGAGGRGRVGAAVLS